ncbi:putative glycolipid-binding domain-containing protein [Pedobacter punctiformis]|uniref:Glycolipid-binding domain-containing protein n=1 Tax=Pedobacter punctiformis TaxID=3004097 RepID=A0ABT4LG54_9SPHI|nr:putative glycolipid-binding domain-containing protein [Pedobacter sp. HCMS5-2]MCZ4245804.1 putative glycolipid-binding domain-containing protein [Pedobacter sp. HCMS5-2]
MKKIQLIWKGQDSIENFLFNATENGYTAIGFVNGMDDHQPFCIRYKINISKDWKVKDIEIQSLTDEKKRVFLSTDLNGNWYNENNKHCPEFNGCNDIDISLTPFTNTLPINRLGEKLKNRTRIEVVYFKLPEFEIRKVIQYYSLLKPGLFKYEGVLKDFTADLPVDDDGFVIHYPDLFERIYTEKAND